MTAAFPTKDTDNFLCILSATNWVRSLAVLPDGSLASGSDDTKIKIWDTIKGIEIKTLTGHTSWVLSLAVLPDGSLDFIRSLTYSLAVVRMS